jgi:integrase
MGALKESLLDKIGYSDYDPHGFRSTFADWRAEKTNFSWDLAEMQLAHVVGNKTERSYRRSDLLERRGELAEAWAKFCDGLAGATVVPFRMRASGDDD